MDGVSSDWGCSILCKQGWRTSGVDNEVKIQTTSKKRALGPREEQVQRS